MIQGIPLEHPFCRTGIISSSHHIKGTFIVTIISGNKCFSVPRLIEKTELAILIFLLQRKGQYRKNRWWRKLAIIWTWWLFWNHAKMPTFIAVVGLATSIPSCCPWLTGGWPSQFSGRHNIWKGGRGKSMRAKGWTYILIRWNAGVTKKYHKFIFEYWVFSQISYLKVWCFEKKSIFAYLKFHICIPKILHSCYHRPCCPCPNFSVPASVKARSSLVYNVFHQIGKIITSGILGKGYEFWQVLWAKLILE